MNFSKADNEKVSAEFFEFPKNRFFEIERNEAEKLLSKIFQIIEKPEIITDLRSVDVRYQAEIQWENLDFVENKKSGEFKAFSNEWFIESIESALDETDDKRVAERFQKILDKKPHRHALEIYSIVKDFARKYLR